MCPLTCSHCLPLRRAGPPLIHCMLSIVSRRGDRMNVGPYATRRHLHEIRKVWLRIPACLNKIDDNSFARLELGL
jgi:hypothetical protein